jgi:hypothetical protein
MSPVGFEPTISAGERPQTYVLDRAVTQSGTLNIRNFCHWSHRSARRRTHILFQKDCAVRIYITYNQQIQIYLIFKSI